MSKRTPKPVRCWVPVSPHGHLWVEWAERSKRRLIRKLNVTFAGWREDGYRVVACVVTVEEKR